MNPQLKSFLELLNSNNIQYWVDSGTLLGLVRGGDILPNDKDIDIGVHFNQLNKINLLRTQIASLGYSIRTEFYNGDLFKYKLYPRIRGNKLLIDLNIYRQNNNNYLWCPVTYFEKPKGYLFKKFQKIVKFFWRRVFTAIETNKFPYNRVKKNYTWVIPYKYYENLIYNKEFLCYMFSNYKEYLKYRYKNWEIYVEEWDTFKDDGGIVYKTPENVISKKF